MAVEVTPGALARKGGCRQGDSAGRAVGGQQGEAGAEHTWSGQPCIVTNCVLIMHRWLGCLPLLRPTICHLLAGLTKRKPHWQPRSATHMVPYHAWGALSPTAVQ